MPTWPADLPQEFERDGFEDELADHLVRSSGPGVPAQPRRLALHGDRSPVRGRMLMTTTEHEHLITWYEDELADGVLSFDFPDPDSEARTIRVAFVGPPALSTVGGELHQVELSLQRQQ